jgi:hypothetical protein
MNEFYSIAEEGREPENSLQLRNLGKQTVMGIIGKSIRGDWGERRSQSQTYYKETTSEDYDFVFANKLTGSKPPYELCDVLDYHLAFYVNKNNGDALKFVKQIKYVVLPIIKKRKDKDAYIEIISEWINQHEMKPKPKEQKAIITMNIENINAPAQFQLNSDNSHQSQQISYSQDNIRELFDLLKKDIEKINSDLKDDFQLEIESALKQLNKGKGIGNRLLTIGTFIKDVGINTFANLVAAPIFELMKPALGL